MSSERWSKVESIFHAALREDPQIRATYLERACAGDAELRREVESLIVHFERPDNLFDTGQQRPLLAGQRLGHYVIEGLLGSGGMGQVYRARDTRLDRAVAVKVLSPVFVRKDGLARLYVEARAASALNHPNIVTVHDFGEAEGHHFLVTELIEGRTMRDLLSGDRILPEEVVRIVIQVASALHATHSANIVHRDIKPENIMLRPDGYVKVLDFGLAKPVIPEADQALTASGVVVGTYRYMSPEQLRGDRVGPATDLWSLGLVTYEMLTGSLPDAFGAIQIPASAQVPPGLQAAIRRALRDPGTVPYDSAEEMISELRGITFDPPARTPPQRFASRSRLFGAAIAIACASLAAILISTRPNLPVNYQLARLATNGNVISAAISPDGRYVAYAAGGSGQQSLWVRQVDWPVQEQRTPPANQRLGGITFAKDSTSFYYLVYESTNISALFRLPVLGGSPRRVLENVDSPVAFSPDGGSLAFIRSFPRQAMNRLIVAKTDGTEEKVLVNRWLPYRFSLAGCSWSPNGHSLLCAAEAGAAGGMTIVDVNVSTLAQRSLVSATVIGRVAWLADGTGFVTTTAAGRAMSRRIQQFAYPSGATTVLNNDSSSYFDLTVAHDTHVIAGVQDDPVSYITVAEDHPWRQRRITSDTAQYRGVAWTPQGNLLTHSQASGKSDIWSIAPDGSHAQRLTETASEEQDAVVCGEYLVFSSNRSGQRNIWRTGQDGNNWKRLSTGLGPDLGPQCSPDGKTIVFQAGIEGRFSVAKVPIDGGPVVPITSHVSTGSAISPDGRFVACHYNLGEPTFKWSVAVLPMDGGVPSQLLSGIPADSKLKWLPKGDMITYSQTENTVSNIWGQRLEAGPPVKLTHFDNDQILAFDWRNDGALACVRAIVSRNLVVLSPAQEPSSRGMKR